MAMRADYGASCTTVDCGGDGGLWCFMHIGNYLLIHLYLNVGRPSMDHTLSV